MRSILSTDGPPDNSFLTVCLKCVYRFDALNVYVHGYCSASRLGLILGGSIRMKAFANEVLKILQKGRLLKFATLAMLGLAMCSFNAIAQSGAGSIEGRVTDSTGAIMPGASIHVVNHDTGSASDTKANGAGYYQVPGLFTGTYLITVTGPGMETDQETVQLLVGQNATRNFSLKAGEVSQKVDVNANTVQLVTTTSATLSSTLENDRINQLPMNGREIITLVGETTPGLTSHYGPGTIANGLLEDSSIEYEADGVPLLNRNFGGPNSMTQSQYPDPDTIQEVRTETSNSGAQFATPATTIISTKSGTNSLHGSAFETMRNNGVGIARNRSNPPNFVAPHLVRNEFGASAGGPIILPHVYHGKDKSFWFFAYERFSLAQEVSTLTAWPTPSMSQGNFSGLVNSSGVLQTLYDPATTIHNTACPVPNSTSTTNNLYCRQTFTQEYNETGANVNSIPSSEISPVAKLYYKLLAPPTTAADPL